MPSTVSEGWRQGCGARPVPVALRRGRKLVVVAGAVGAAYLAWLLLMLLARVEIGPSVRVAAWFTWGCLHGPLWYARDLSALVLLAAGLYVLATVGTPFGDRGWGVHLLVVGGWLALPVPGLLLEFGTMIT